MALDVLTLLAPLLLLMLYAALFGVIVMATRTFASALFDTKRAAGHAGSSLNMKVENGEITEDSSPLLRGMGGPGFLLVDEHSAAVLETFGHFTRVVGGGYKLLERYERVRGAVDLRRHLRKGTSKVYTRDGLPVEYDVEMEFRILPAPSRRSPRLPARTPGPPPGSPRRTYCTPSHFRPRPSGRRSIRCRSSRTERPRIGAISCSGFASQKSTHSLPATPLTT